MTSTMLKAPPTIETCLFGPSGIPLHIESFHGAFMTKKHSKKSSTSQQVMETPLKDRDLRQHEQPSDISSGDRQQDQDAQDGNGGIILTDIPRPKSPSSNAEGSSCSTPPQTPLRATPPTRPMKQIPTITKSNTAQVSTSPQLPIQNDDPNDLLSTPSPPPAPHTINLQELRRLISQGVPSTCTYRALSWRVLLKSLPLDTGQWQEIVDRDRSLYRNLVEELFVLPSWAETVKDPNVDFEEYGWLEFSEREGKSLACVWNDGDWVTLKDAMETMAKGSTSREISHDSFQNGSTSTQESTVVPVAVHEGLGLASGEGVEIIQSTSQPGDQDPQSPGKLSTIATTGLYSPPKRVSRGMSPKADEPLEEIPFKVLEQWRKSGRDPDSLSAGMGRVASSSVIEKYLNVLHISNTGLETPVYPNPYGDPNWIDEDADSDGCEGVEHSGIFLSKSSSTDGDIDPKWTALLENAFLLDEIRKDVVRTHPDLQFFLNPKNNLGLRRYAALERILFVWAKLNKGVRYVQGMNEIVGTIYFILANDPNKDWSCEAEADTYFLFNTLMVEMRDIFVPDLDDADTGIHGRMGNMISLLSLHDPEVRCHLDECGIDPSFYSIRWLTTLLSREFTVPDTARLWDSMFASTHRDNFMRYACVCMVMIIREDLLKGDFGTCLRLLQAYPPTNIDQLLESSRALWIYESQVTLACHKGGISLSQALTAIMPPPAVIMAYGLYGGMVIDTDMEKSQITTRHGKVGKVGKLNHSNGTAGKFLGFFGFNNGGRGGRSSGVQ